MPTTKVTYPHLSVSDDGVIKLAGTRYKVVYLAGEHYHYGWSAEEILRNHPDLLPAQVYAALTYFYDHYDEVVAELESVSEVVEKYKPTRWSRSELLARKKGRASGES